MPPAQPGLGRIIFADGGEVVEGDGQHIRTGPRFEPGIDKAAAQQESLGPANLRRMVNDGRDRHIRLACRLLIRGFDVHAPSRWIVRAGILFTTILIVIPRPAPFNRETEAIPIPGGWIRPG